MRDAGEWGTDDKVKRRQQRQGKKKEFVLSSSGHHIFHKNQSKLFCFTYSLFP